MKKLLLAAIAILMFVMGMSMPRNAAAATIGRQRPECKAEDGYLFRQYTGNIICKLYKVVKPTAVKVKVIKPRPVRQTRRTTVTRLSRSRVVRSPLKTRITKQVHKPLVYTRLSQRSIRKQISHELENFDLEHEKARIREVQRIYSERRLKRIKY